MRDGKVNRAIREGRTRGTEIRSRGAVIARNCARLDVPWARCGLARGLRELILGFGLSPAMSLYVRRRVRRREVFDGLQPAVLFVANHSSHMDTPAILRALPRQWRHRTAVAAAADYFYKKRVVAHAVALLFNTVPLARSGGGLGEGATEHLDRLIDERWNLLLYPEGTRSRDGRIGKLRSGAAVIATEHGMPIVPIHVTGTHAAMPPGQSWPRLRLGRRYPVTVTFGDPIHPLPGEHRNEMMERVRAFYRAQTGEPLAPALEHRRRAAPAEVREPVAPAA